MMTELVEVLIIGFGNTLRGDDALGRIAADRLQTLIDHELVRVISQSAPTPELAAEIAQSSTVVFLDASADGPADRIVTKRINASETSESMAHRLDATALLGLTHHLYNRSPEAFAITFRGQSFEFSDQQLSPEANAACDLIVQETLKLIGGPHPETDHHLNVRHAEIG